MNHNSSQSLGENALCTISALELRTMIITCRICIVSCIACILVMFYSFYLMYTMPMMGSMHRADNGASSAENSHALMTMADMENMLIGKSGDDLDRAFLEAMIPHHQWAIDMAKYLQNAKHSELQSMWKEIIQAQQREIDQMRQWQQEWGYMSDVETMDHGSMGH